MKVTAPDSPLKVVLDRPRRTVTLARTAPTVSAVDGDTVSIDGQLVSVTALQSTSTVRLGSSGRDGRTIELAVLEGHIAWRYIGEPDWTNLIALEELRGPAGDSSEALAYRHIQAVPEAEWVIPHPLSFTPNVTVINSAGEVVLADVTYGAGVVTVHHAAAVGGEAILS